MISFVLSQSSDKTLLLMRRLARFAMYRAVVGYPLFATRVYHAPQFQNFGVDPGFALGGAATADIFLDVSSIILCF